MNVTLAIDSGDARVLGEDDLNIFYVHKNPTIAAEMLCDSHVRKMVLETTQLLANVYYMEGAQHAPPTKKDGTPYRPAHMRHPCAIWAMEDFKQWMWLMTHGFALARQFEKRFHKQHACYDALRYMSNPANIPIRWMKHKVFWEPPMCVDEKYKKVPLGWNRPMSATKVYRAYYVGEKSHLFTWTNATRPDWTYDMEAIKKAAEELIDACDLELVKPDRHRPEGMDDATWERIKQYATDDINGREAEQKEG